MIRARFMGCVGSSSFASCHQPSIPTPHLDKDRRILRPGEGDGPTSRSIPTAGPNPGREEHVTLYGDADNCPHDIYIPGESHPPPCIFNLVPELPLPSPPHSFTPHGQVTSPWPAVLAVGSEVAHHWGGWGVVLQRAQEAEPSLVTDPIPRLGVAGGVRMVKMWERWY